jgi:biotin operon repressor
MLGGIDQPTAAEMTGSLGFLTVMTSPSVHIDQRPRSRSMDDLDKQLIFILRADGRASVASLAKSLGVARGTVQNRMARLEAEGVIVGYTVQLRPQVDEDRRIRGLMMIVAELRADSLQEFDRVLARVRLLDGIANTETNLLLSTHKL